jgi:hypothetical protein
MINLFIKSFLTIYFTFLISILLNSCTSVPIDDFNSSIIGNNGYKDFVPIDPLPSNIVTFNDPTTGDEITRAWAMLSNTRILELLGALHSDISVGKYDVNGSLTYLVGKATTSVGNYRVIFDYIQYKPEKVFDPTTKKELGYGRIGIGMRMTADIKTFSANVDLSSLFALGIAAATNKLTGKLSVDIYGISSKDVQQLFITSTSIDETSIQKTLESMAVIKSKVYDSATKLTPYILAVKPIDNKTTPEDVKLQIK